MTEPISGRGVLYPARLPTFHRIAAPADLGGLIRWFWIPRWNLPPGRTSRQHLLSFPASNLVVEPSGVSLAGPTTRASYRDLSGSGWGVGALLRPAAVPSLLADPQGVRDALIRYDAGDLHRSIVAAMDLADEAAARERAVEAFAAWARQRLAPPDETGLLANAIEDLIANDSDIVRVEQLALQSGLTQRGVQRLAKRYVGLPPLTIIRRYRLQEAVQRLREDGSLTIARVAADLGYADHAHLTRDFRRVLGLTPHAYRHDARA